MVWIGVVLGAVGALFLVVGAVTGVRLRRFLSTAVPAHGKVVGFEEQLSTDSDGDTTSSTHAVVEFATAGGATVMFTEESQTIGGLAEGATVPVKYDPAAPEKARIATGGRLWVTPIVLLAIGAGLLIAGLVTGFSGG